MKTLIYFAMLIALGVALHLGGIANATESAEQEPCKAFLLRQDSPSTLDLRDINVCAQGVSLSSFVFKAPKGMSIEQFVSTTESEIKTQLNSYLSHASLKITANMPVLIDIEVPISPRHFSDFRRDHGEGKFKSFIEAFKLRIDTAKAVMPQARIGLYGVPIPTGMDDSLSRLSYQMSGIHAAASMGLFDSVDAIYPTLYFRFGPSDKDYEGRISRYTRAAIQAALTVRRSDNSNIAVVPLLSHKIYNGNSVNNGETAPVRLGRTQLDVASEFPEIESVSYWTPSDSEELKRWLEDLRPTTGWGSLRRPRFLTITKRNAN